MAQTPAPRELQPPQDAPISPAKAVNPVKGRFYHPELDVLRFFAFLAVFVHHTLPDDAAFYLQRHLFAAAAPLLAATAASGAFGVDLFFVLSAYLITELLVREKTAFGAVDVRSFYLRRILRIWPLYFFFLGVAALLPHISVEQHVDWKYLLGYVVLAGNWVCALRGFPDSVIRPLWSVSIEEQFYLLWPLGVRRLSRRGMMILALALVGVAWFTRLILALRHASEIGIYCNTFARVDAIAAGILIALWLKGKQPSTAVGGRALLFLAGGSLWLAAAHYCGMRNPFPTTGAVLVRYPLVVLGSVMMLLAFLTKSLPMRARALTYLGRISYGLYVYHLLALLVAGRLLGAASGRVAVYLAFCVLGLAVTIAMASASYRWLELPFLRLKERFTYVPSRPEGAEKDSESPAGAPAGGELQPLGNSES